MASAFVCPGCFGVVSGGDDADGEKLRHPNMFCLFLFGSRGLGLPARCPLSPNLFWLGDSVPLLKQTTDKSWYQLILTSQIWST